LFQFTNIVKHGFNLSVQQENRLKQIGATVRSALSYFERMKLNVEKEKM